MEINSSDRNMRPSSENSPAQASGSQGAVKKVTNNPSFVGDFSVINGHL
ncbi:hypothetical protein Tco_0476573, partial [Tanacetum coccineum]